MGSVIAVCKKGADLLARLVSHGARGVAVRRLGGSRAGEIRFTRFLRNPSVTGMEMISTAFARSQAVCAGRDVLAVQDTIVTRSSGGGGEGLHAMIAVDAESGNMLGPLDAQFPERREGGKASRHARRFEGRQSVRWLEAARTTWQIEGAARVTVVADREADIFALFAGQPADVDLLMRTMHDRVLAGGGRMSGEIAAGPHQGCMRAMPGSICPRDPAAGPHSKAFGPLRQARPAANRDGQGQPQPGADNLCRSA